MTYRIYHNGDTAGVGTKMAAYAQSQKDFEFVVRLRKGGDLYDRSGYYKDRTDLRLCRPYIGLGEAIVEAWRADIIHIHGFKNYPMPPWYLRKKMIIHYHGLDIRTNTPKQRRKWEAAADTIIVSTPSLLEYEFEKDPIYLPTLVDTELFSARPPGDPNRGLCFLKRHQDPGQTMDIIRELGYGDVSWDFIGRRSPDGQTYAKMPDFLARYGWYADIAIIDGVPIDDRQMAGMEACNVGCKVITQNGELLTKVPTQHTPEQVISKLISIYRTLLD